MSSLWSLSGTFNGSAAFSLTATNPYYPAHCDQWFSISVTISGGSCDTFSGGWSNPGFSGNDEAGTKIPLSITGANVVWSFGGQTPSGYDTSITLTSSAARAATWSIVSGSNKISTSTTALRQSTSPVAEPCLAVR